MFNKLRLKEILTEYKKCFVQTQWQKEKYKWEAVKCFQVNWDIDAEDFANMLAKALSQTGSLLTSKNDFPVRMMIRFAEIVPEEVRIMFAKLFDKSRDLYKRIVSFKRKCNHLLEKYGNANTQQYQYENAICTYLWLRYPDQYYIYKLDEIKMVSNELESDYVFKEKAYVNNLRNFFSFYNEICTELKKDDELKNLLASQITGTCYPDTELRTLTMDVAFFICRYVQMTTDEYLERNRSEIRYWFLNADPTEWKMSTLPVGETEFYTLYNERGHKRRVFQNFLDAREGDMVIGYESTPVKQIVAIMRVRTGQDGREICFEKLENLSSPIHFAALKEYSELEHMEYFINPRGSLFKLTKDEYELILTIIREENPVLSQNSQNRYKYEKADFLKDVYMEEEQYERLTAVLKRKKNVILQGAPGVGKTFTAKRLAYAMMGENDDDRIEFVQFHQNYSYEDFMMGYKPVGDGFELKSGIFYRFCQKALQHSKKDYFFIIDEINRGNTSKIFGELLMLIESDYRGRKITLAYDGSEFSVPENVYIIGMMNTADRSLAMIDYALRRRFSFFDMEPGFESRGFIKYQNELANDTFNQLIACIKDLNREIAQDRSLGRGFCIGHSYFCNMDAAACTETWMRNVIDFDILPMLNEYWFDDEVKLQRWKNMLYHIF